MGAVTVRDESRGRLWRSRWAAIGAAVAVTFGAGGLAAVNAAGGVDSTTVLTDPVRVLDSRDPVNVGLPGPFESQSPQKLQITGSIATTTGTKTVVPTGATGVLLNVTAVAPEADGFISIRPGDATGLPTTSSLNVSVGEVLANAVLVALPTSGTTAGQIDIAWDAYGFLEPRTDILIDVVGYTSASKLDALQAEVDAVEAVNATQQTKIDAKANSTDVYTKAETDVAIAGSPNWAATGDWRSPGGASGLTFPFAGNPWTFTAAEAGTYLIDVNFNAFLACPTASNSWDAWLAVDDVTVPGSTQLAEKGSVFRNVRLAGPADLAAGPHTVTVETRCDDGASYGVASIASGFVLAWRLGEGTGAEALQLDAEASRPSGNCTVIDGQEPTCGP